MDLLACLLCVFTLGLSLWFLIKSKCQHLEWSWQCNRCVSCGISYKQLLMEGKNHSKYSKLSRNESPYEKYGIWFYTQYRVEDDPLTGMSRLIEVVVEDAPQSVKEQHAETMQRRVGLAWYRPVIWKDCE